MENNLKSQILRESEKINSYFLDSAKLPESLDIYTGMSGNLLFMAQNFLWSGNQIYLDKVSDYLAVSIERIENALNKNYDFSLSLSGWGWVLSYLEQNEIADTAEVLCGIDGYLKSAMDWLLRSGNYDQLNGALRIGRYFLSKRDPEQVGKIIEYLYTNKIIHGNGLLWRKQKDGVDLPQYDLSLAHGAAGLLRFFCSCVESGIREEECRGLMEGTICFILNNIQDHRLIGSSFPSMVSAEDYHNGQQKYSRSRLAWCYGDLGIWYSLYSAAVLLKNEALELQALAGLETLTSRRTLDNTMVVDAGFCHGSSGIAFVFNKIWNATRREVFKEARDFWLGDTLRYGANDYQFLVGNFKERYFKPCDTLLEGLIGVGLSYGSCLNPGQEQWDQCLLLS